MNSLIIFWKEFNALGAPIRTNAVCSLSVLEKINSSLIYWRTLETQFYIHCLFHMADLRMFPLSFFICLHNGPWFVVILICSCRLFWRNTDVSVFQQLLSDKCEFNSIWKHFLLVARCLNQWKGFWKKLFNYTSSCSVSLLMSVLIFQTAITGGWCSRMSRYFCLLCNELRGIW